MSGIEVAGLMLGALPVLIEAIDGYKSGINKIKSGFKKRKVIDKLGRALRFQKSIIEAITRNVLAQSGCDDAAGATDAQLQFLLQDKQIQEMVNDFLGRENAQVFLDALRECMADISHATIGLASLIPALASVKNKTNVQAILTANATSEKRQIQLFERLSIVFNLENLEQEIEALDRFTDSLDKFQRHVTGAYQPGQNAPSRKAIKLAKALQVVRQNAVILHSALTRKWVTPCHQRHELKVFLEYRTAEAMSKQDTIDARASCFKVVFVGGLAQPIDFWHETLFHIEAEDDQLTGNAHPSQGPRIRFSAPQQQTTKPRLDVPDICTAITNATCSAQFPVFHLISSGNMAMTLHTQAIATTQSWQSPSKTLQKIFQERHDRNSPCSPLPWKWRMLLALKIASSFLQFIRTQWVQPSWSASKIHIPYLAGSHDLDFSRPFLSADFSKNSSPPATTQAQVKEDLLELGILLLEIWHENNLESQFAQQLNSVGTSNTSFMRRACALQWLEDSRNPLPDLYYRAVSHCASGLIAPDPRASEWDDLDLCKSVCENIIDPLSKVAQI